MQNPQENMDFSQSILSLIFIISISVLSFFVLRPFAIGFAWSVILVVSTWPIMLKIEQFLWGKRILAIFFIIMTLFLLLTVPVFLIANSVIDTSIPFLHWLFFHTSELPELVWLQDMPFFGSKIFNFYQSLLDGERNHVICAVKPYINNTATVFFFQVKNIGIFIANFLLIFICSIILYWNGEKCTAFIRDFSYRINVQHGESIIFLAGQVVRAVALGVVLTALIQALLSGIGIIVAGVPYGKLLTMCIVFSCLVQIGSLPILIPSIIWLYWNHNTAWGTALLIWSSMICILDNILRPYLIRMGSDFPVLLILFGVIGGLISFGIIGLFIGPVVLVIAYRLLILWVYKISISSLLEKKTVTKNK